VASAPSPLPEEIFRVNSIASPSIHLPFPAPSIFNHIQLGDPGQLTLIYDPASASTGFLDAPPTFGVITSTVNFNNNNDNDSPPNVGTGLPRQIQFMLRLK
jgi:hypothetical protein